MFLSDVCAVVIGRNEGERLRNCLQSVRSDVAISVYVDSGSSDSSIQVALGMNVHVVNLNMDRPFTAARARNAGFTQALELIPNIDFIQFVDGDCEVQSGWLGTAHEYLLANPNVAAVCGRLREKFPERSIYNRLCDLEWDTPIGATKACGGIAMIRASAMLQTGGFRDSLIAGEEPELCIRLRALGWEIQRLDAEMARHDAAMVRFAQWWKRATRSGYAFAEGAYLHGNWPERHWVYESRRAIVWGVLVPVSVLALTALVGPVLALLFCIYPLQIVRLFIRESGNTSTRMLKAAFYMLARFPEAAGYLKFMADRLRRRQANLIEYKG